MKKFIVLVNIQLNANDEYSDYIDDIFVGVYEADSEEEAIVKADVTEDMIKNMSGFAVGYDYCVHAKVA